MFESQRGVTKERRPAKWTASVVGDMHLFGITATELAAEIGWHPKYLSVVLNGHREPKGAELTVRAALDRLIVRQNSADEAG